MEWLTTVRMDESTETKIQINFNVTLHHLPCRFASVDIADVMGTHLQNVSANILKTRLDAGGLSIGRAAPQPRQVEHGFARAADSESVPMVCPELDEAGLRQAVSQRKLVLVNYYAPWCPWCRRLQPVWEEAYANVMRKAGLAEHAMMAKADCTAGGSELCRNQHIHAFPTVRVYRHHASVSHESYVGDRTHEALEKFVEDNVHDDDHKEAVQSGASEIGALGEGCTIAGAVLVNRVPGNFHISAHSKAHSFQPGKLNMTHAIGRMTFGRPLTPSMRRLLPDDVVAAHDVLAGTLHVAAGQNTTLEHYIKVVHTSHLYFRRQIDTYQYTANSNNYQDGGSLPSAVFSYDMSPMQVLVEREGKSLAAFLTQLCAIIGGVFTVTGLIDSVVYHSSNVIKRKMQVGKLI